MTTALFLIYWAAPGLFVAFLVTAAVAVWREHIHHRVLDQLDQAVRERDDAIRERDETAQLSRTVGRTYRNEHVYANQLRDWIAVNYPPVPIPQQRTGGEN